MKAPPLNPPSPGIPQSHPNCALTLSNCFQIDCMGALHFTLAVAGKNTWNHLSRDFLRSYRAIPTGPTPPGRTSSGPLPQDATKTCLSKCGVFSWKNKEHLLNNKGLLGPQNVVMTTMTADWLHDVVINDERWLDARLSLPHFFFVRLEPPMLLERWLLGEFTKSVQFASLCFFVVFCKNAPFREPVRTSAFVWFGLPECLLRDVSAVKIQGSQDVLVYKFSYAPESEFELPFWLWVHTWSLTRGRKTNKHKLLFRVVAGMGGGQICLCVCLFFLGKVANTETKCPGNFRKMLGQSLKNTGTVPWKFCLSLSLFIGILQP